MQRIETSERVSLESMMGSVGGHLGLWMGVSVVTIIHLLLYTSYFFVDNRVLTALVLLSKIV